MSDQSTQNPTPTVQVKEIGLQEQASLGRILAVAGIAGAAVAGVVAMLTEKEQPPASKAESARAYLQNALETAQSKDIAKISRKEKKRVAKKVKKSSAKAAKNTDAVIEQTRKKANESAATARGEFSNFLNTLKGGGMELERLAEDFAESTLMTKLKEFGEEARVMAEQGKVKSAEAAHKAQTKTAEAAHKAQTKTAEAAHKAQDDLIPQVVDVARHARDSSKERVSEVADKAKNDFIPAAQKATADVQAHAREVAATVGSDAEKRLTEAAHVTSEKSKQAGSAVQRGGRETRSLLLWLSLAGILIFTVFLDEDQQKKLKEIAVEVFGEARDMYGDMKGDSPSS